MNWVTEAITILKIALSLVPQALDIVKAVETPGNGAAKAQTVGALIAAAFDLLPPDVGKLIGADKLKTFTQSIIGTLVGFLNLVGAFKKTP